MRAEPDKRNIERSEAYVALITDDFKADPKCLAEAQYAATLKKPMYALIRYGTELGHLESYNWRRKFYFSSDSGKEFADIVEEMQRDLREWDKEQK